MNVPKDYTHWVVSQGRYQGADVPVLVDDAGRGVVTSLSQQNVEKDPTEATTWDSELLTLLSNLNRIRNQIISLSGEAWGTVSHSIATIWGKFSLLTGHAHDGTADNGAQISHANLSGLTGTDHHTQYLKTDGSRALTGDQSAGTHKITNLGAPTADNDATRKKYVDDAIAAGSGGLTSGVVTVDYDDLAGFEPPYALFNLPALGVLFDISVEVVTPFSTAFSANVGTSLVTLISPFAMASAGLKGNPYTYGVKFGAVGSVTAIGLYRSLAGAWTALNSMNTARKDLGGCGTTSAALSIGGSTGSDVHDVELWDGTVWTAAADLAGVREWSAAAGTASAAISFGGHTGSVTGITESWNGSAWSTVNSLNTARYGLAGCGSQDAALSISGYTTNTVTTCEQWNGTSWVSANAVNTKRIELAAAGTTAAAVSFGGADSGYNATTETFNGTAWSAANNMNTARRGLGGAGDGINALSFGGNTGSVSKVTEAWDGSSWSAQTDMNTARKALAGAGTANVALSFGGDTGSVSAVTEKRVGDDFPSDLTAGQLKVRYMYDVYAA